MPSHVAPKHEKIDMEIYIKALRKCPSTRRSKDSLEKAEKVVKAPRNPMKRKGVIIFSRLESTKL